MTNQKTPEQGGATEEQIEAAARVLFEESQELDQDNSWDDELPDEWRETWRYMAEMCINAALSASAFAHPADERHDAEERQAESEDHAATAAAEDPVTAAQKAVWGEVHGQDPRRKYTVAEVKRLVYRLDNAIAAALAAPVEVDAEKLADAIADELGTDSWIARSLSNGRIIATARHLVEFAVKPVLRGEGR